VDVLQELPPRMAKVEAEIVQLRTDMNSGFSALSYAINKMHSEIVTRFDAMDQRFDAMDRRFDAMDRRLDAMDERFDAMDRRFDAQDVEIALIKQKL
jgi:hypothetical protein